jgi:putative tricarboxylic transport membrane protein
LQETFAKDSDPQATTMKLRHKDKKSSLFWFILGGMAVITARRTGIGTLTSPGPGFLPLVGGLLMILLSLIIFIQAFSREAKEAEKGWIKIGNWRIWLVTVCLFFYTFSLNRLGFVIGTFLLLVFLFQLIERKSWLWATFTAGATIFAVYMVFYVWLQIQLPRGFWGF